LKNRRVFYHRNGEEGVVNAQLIEFDIDESEDILIENGFLILKHCKLVLTDISRSESEKNGFTQFMQENQSIFEDLDQFTILSLMESLRKLICIVINPCHLSTFRQNLLH
jgi:hypothetical protein